MALIYRSILEAADPELVDHAPDLFSGWLGWKFRAKGLEFPLDEVVTLHDGIEVMATGGQQDGFAAYRGTVYEPRPNGEQLRTTFTAMQDGSDRFAWIDLQRWSEDAFDTTWIPYAPGMVTQVLGHCGCSRGGVDLANDFVTVEGDQAGEVVARILDPTRTAPIVVVTPTREELEGDLEPARERARELQRRLAGIAAVVLLGRGAVSAASRAMLDAGPSLDVHSGAVRTYLPGTGASDDWPRRHRWVPYHRLAGRPADMAARLVSMPLMRAACQTPPPAAWREHWRPLVEPTPVGATDCEELLEMSLAETREAERARDEQAARADEAEFALGEERDTVAELLAAQDRLERTVGWLQRQIRERGDTLVPEPEAELFEPDFCSEVVEHAEAELEYVVLGPAVTEGADDLDQHAEPSWARKAWRALRALDAYAHGKAAGTVRGNFMNFCEQGEGPVIPTSWIALSESETTDQNDRFRELRTFTVEPDVDAAGRLYMPAHIKLEKGGNPAPRLHFCDDTDGDTGKVHVGWLGPHRDNKSKT